MTLEVTAYTGLGPGPHDITVTGLEVKASKVGGQYLRWEFTRDDGNSTSANSSVEMTPGNKTGKWFAALTGKPTVVGEKRQIAEVIGKKGSIFVELNADGFTKVVGLTARGDAMAVPVTPAQKAETQHALQEGDEDPTALPF